MMDPTRFPLSWPAGWPRTPRHKQTRNERFMRNLSVARATDAVLDEVRSLGGRGVVISTNLELKRDGLPYSNRRAPDDPGAAVYFRLKDKPLVLACDRWDRVEQNLWAIAKHIDALRGQERWGVGTVAQAFAGYTALPDHNGKRPWWEVLGVPSNASISEVQAQFRNLAALNHPDRGGDTERMAEINAAYEEARRGRS